MLLRHSALYFLARGVPGTINLFAITIYTRLLLPAEYGNYALVLAGVNLCSAVFFQWLQLGALRFRSAYTDRPERFFATVLAGYLGTVALSAFLGLTGLVSILAVEAVPEPVLGVLIESWLLGLGLLWVSAMFELQLSLVTSELRPDRYGAMALGRSVLALALATSLISLGLGAHGVLLGLLLASVVTVAGPVWRTFGGSRLRDCDPVLLRQFGSYGAPLTATAALLFVISSSDRFLIEGFLGSAAVGRYAAAYDLTQFTLGTLMHIINLAAFPLIVQALEQRGPEAARCRLEQLCTFLLGLSLPSALGLALLAEPVAGVFLGDLFRDEATSLVRLVALAMLLAGLKSYYFDLSFQLARSTGIQLWIGGVAAGVNLLLNLWWIPRFGPIGAAAATIVAYGLGLGLSFGLGRWCPRRVLRLPWPGRDVTRIVCASAIMALAVLAIETWLPRSGFRLVLPVAGGVVVYVLALLALDVAGVRVWLVGSGLRRHFRRLTPASFRRAGDEPAPPPDRPWGSGARAARGGARARPGT